jgi:hypothetical protein
MGRNFWHYILSSLILSKCFDVVESAIYEKVMVIWPLRVLQLSRDQDNFIYFHKQRKAHT